MLHKDAILSGAFTTLKSASVSRRCTAPSPRGIALVIVLSCLVLVSVLVVAFLQAVRTEVGASQSYASGTKTRMLADSAVNVVIGQIQEATQRNGEAWISQPGLIRTYDNQGDAVTAYKLYSSDTLVVNGEFNPLAGDGSPADVPPDWRTEGANVFADLNEPVVTAGVPFYPILDPDALEQVEGFEVNGSPDSTGLEHLLDREGNVLGKIIPMPVRWLYVLKDGSRAVAVPVPGSNGKKVTIVGATPDNPAVARLAYWTDDETAKVNINTASEGTFWDTPVANSWPSAAGKGNPKVAESYSPDPAVPYELDLAYYQARQNEFQRYPGHPSTTSLSPVLWKPLAKALNITDPDAPSVRSQLLDAIYAITPRIVGADPNDPSKDYTSKGGTQNIFEHVYASGGVTGRIPLDSDRLYANVDELLFTQEMGSAPPHPTRVSSELGTSEDETKKVLSTAKFFLTSHSRSPEVNLFNEPRISIWPITVPSGQPDSDSRLTGFDKVIKLCASIGTANNAKFFFTRSSPLSSQVDLLGSTDNMRIYSYLQDLTGEAIPGFGGDFASKYTSSERDQILTEIFDYIRCTNLSDVTVGAPFTPPSPVDAPSVQGMVIPIAGPNGSRGFGRVATISEIAVGFQKIRKEGKIFVEAMVLPEMYSPMAGYSALAVNAKVTFSGMSAFTVNGQPIFERDEFVMVRDKMPNRNFQSRFGGNIGPTVMYRIDKPVKPSEYCPPTGEIETGEILAITIAGKFQVTLESPADSSGTPETLQKFNVEFPSTTLQFTKNGYGAEWIAGSPGAYMINLSEDIPFGNNNHLVRSVVPSGAGVQGDLRLVAISRDPERYFEKINGYDNATATKAGRRASTLKGLAQVGDDAKFGSLIEGVPIGENSSPDLPPGINGIDGDWDNAPGTLLDGPFLNKADEGTAFQKVAGAVPYIGHQWAFEASNQAHEVSSPSIFSPNRQVPSPVIFGSLPTGVARSEAGNTLPWQTLLFRPAKGPGGGSLGLSRGVEHPGAANPPDHLLLDLFWMPVVEPYPISDRFSTAGKVNLNYQIVPFTNIERKTGMHAVLKSTKITAINPAAKPGGSAIRQYSVDYKIGGKANKTTNQRDDDTWAGQDIAVRRDIDVGNTLKQFDKRFTENRPFISASEICEIPLVPGDLPDDHVSKFGAVNAGFEDSTPLSQFDQKLKAFWEAHKLTGDNSLERPYAQIYPRVTTKSNTFNVHVRAQVLNMSGPSIRAGSFDETRDRVGGEFRGSFLVERYLDPNLDTYDPDRPGGLGPYKVRIVSSKQVDL